MAAAAGLGAEVAIPLPQKYEPMQPYDEETAAKLFAFFKKRGKAPKFFIFSAKGDLETLEGARVGARGKPLPAETILLKRFVDLDASERADVEEKRLEDLAKIEDDYEAEKVKLSAAWEEYRLTGSMRGVLLANRNLAGLDARRSAILSRVRNVVEMDDLATREILMDRPYETRKLIGQLMGGASDPFGGELYRMMKYPFEQHVEFGKYVADELVAQEEAEAAAAAEAGGPLPTELQYRQKLKDGRLARIFFESSDEHNGFLSPLFPVEFTLNDKRYFTAYQAYEVARAEELGLPETVKLLLGTRSARTMRLQTKKVEGHPKDARGLWLRIYTAIYQQHPALKQKLLDTATDTLVYADMRAGPSGIGLADKDHGALDASKWKGENLVGVVQETLRTQIREESLGSEGAAAEAAPDAEGVITEEQQQKAKVGAIINARRRF